MALSDRFAIQRVFTVDLFDLSTGANIGHMDELKESTMTHDATIVYAQGEINNTL